MDIGMNIVLYLYKCVHLKAIDPEGGGGISMRNLAVERFVKSIPLKR
jgi:hypothetical protein